MTNEESTEKHHLHEKDDAERKSMNQNDSRRVLLPLRSTLKNTHQRRELRSYGNALNQTDCIAHQPDSGYHPRAYVWDHIHIRRSGLIVQKGGSISGPLFSCLSYL